MSRRRSTPTGFPCNLPTRMPTGLPSSWPSYDRLVCTALTARHIGLLDGAAYVQVQQACARKLRALFMLPQGYRLLKIDRDMVRKAMGRSHEARQIMGEVPEAILSGERQAPLVPRKMAFPTAVAGHVGSASHITGNPDEDLRSRKPRRLVCRVSAGESSHRSHNPFPCRLPMRPHVDG